MNTLPTAQELGQRYEFCRVNRGITATEAAQQIGVSKSTLSRITLGRNLTNVDADTMCKIMAWCDRHIDRAAIEAANGDALPAIEKVLEQDTTLTPARRKALFELLKTAYAELATH